jgi:hypothetical protein
MTGVIDDDGVHVAASVTEGANAVTAAWSPKSVMSAACRMTTHLKPETAASLRPAMV